MALKIVVVALWVMFVALTRVQSISAQSMDELYPLAKREGQVTLYGGGPAALYTGWAKLFEEKFGHLVIAGWNPEANGFLWDRR